MMKALLARSVRLEAAMRCDWCHRQIPAGANCYIIMGDNNVKAQGRYHGVMCYRSALADYEKKEKELNIQKQAGE